MLKRSEDARVQRALAGDGRNLGKSRQRKWQRILLHLNIIKEIPATNPQLYEAGVNIRALETYLPFRKELSDGSKILGEDGSVVDKPTKMQTDQSVEQSLEPQRPQAVRRRPVGKHVLPMCRG